LRIVRGMCVPFKLTTNLTQAQRSAHSGGSWVSYFKMITVKKVGQYLEFWANKSLIYDVHLDYFSLKEMRDKRWFTKKVEDFCIKLINQ